MARVVLVAGLIAAVGTVPAVANAQESGIEVGSAAPNARLERLDGTAVDLSTWIGKGPVVMEFWATWCENCRALEPAMKAAQQRYAGRVTFLAIAVSVNQSPERVKTYVERHGLVAEQLFDRHGQATGAYEAPATSYVVVLDRRGRVVYTGLGGTQDLDAAIRKAL